MMNDENTLADRFHASHEPGNPLVLFNVWDPGSARAVAEAGASAIATGSWSVAAAFGFDDGEHLPMELALHNARRIAGSVDLPVTIDFEGGYASASDQVAHNVARLLETGIVGINFEDRVVDGEGLHDIEVQSDRIAAIRSAADKAGIRLFINARTDLFLNSPDADHSRMVDFALARAHAYANAGADGFFVPGLCDETAIGRIVDKVALPVNVMVLPTLPGKDRLKALGVARISHGPGPYNLAIAALQDAARAAL